MQSFETEEMPLSPVADRHCLHRIVMARYIDSLFYEGGNARWSHSRCHALIVRDLCGIGANTFRHYLHYPSGQLAEIELPCQLKELLRLYVMLAKELPPTHAARLLEEFTRIAKHVTTSIREQRAYPDADRMAEFLYKAIDDSSRKERPADRR